MRKTLKREAEFHSAWSFWRAGLANSLAEAYRVLHAKCAAGEAELITAWSGGRKGHPIHLFAVFS